MATLVRVSVADNRTDTRGLESSSGGTTLVRAVGGAETHNERVGRVERHGGSALLGGGGGGGRCRGGTLRGPPTFERAQLE